MNKDKIKQLIDNNRKWAKQFKKQHPGIFEKLANQQSPEYLWIGCSDSRIPANEVIGLLPGEIFVHRNVGNLVHAMDINCHSVIQFAVEVLKVRDIIVGGHYDCGAIKAALSMKDYGMLNNWLRGIKDIYQKNAKQLSELPAQKQIDRLCELNVIEQVGNVCKLQAVQNAWNNNQPLAVHGMIYRISDGMLHDLNCSINSNQKLEEIYKFDNSIRSVDELSNIRKFLNKFKRSN